MRLLPVCASIVVASLVLGPSKDPLLAESPAAILLEQSIAFHDPDESFSTGVFRLEIAESRPDGSERSTEIVIDAGGGTFGYRAERQGRRIEAEIEGSECAVTLDGSSEINAEDVETYGLTCERLQRLRNYYTYLWGLPMKLRDAGTILRREARSTTFLGSRVDELGVTYDSEVGSDTWYFYLDPGSRALVGYRFYHEEAVNDGEYIVLEGELSAGGLRLPKRRTWYTNDGDELLGTDTVMSITRLDGDQPKAQAP